MRNVPKTFGGASASNVHVVAGLKAEERQKFRPVITVLPHCAYRSLYVYLGGIPVYAMSITGHFLLTYSIYDWDIPVFLNAFPGIRTQPELD